MEDQKKQQGRPKKPVSNTTPVLHKKMKLEVVGYEENKPKLKEVREMREVSISKNDAAILNEQELNSLIRYKAV